MKYIALVFITGYQLFLSPLFRAMTGSSSVCRFTPSCSDYAKEQIMHNGIVRGGTSAFRRLIACRPAILSL